MRTRTIGKKWLEFNFVPSFQSYTYPIWIRTGRYSCFGHASFIRDMVAYTRNRTFFFWEIASFSKFSKITDVPFEPRFTWQSASRLVPDFSRFSDRDRYMWRMTRNPTVPMKMEHYRIKNWVKPDNDVAKYVKHIKLERWADKPVRKALYMGIADRCTATGVTGGSHVMHTPAFKLKKVGVLSRNDQRPDIYYFPFLQIRGHSGLKATRVDAVIAIAKGLPKIAGFTFSTEANMLVSMIEIRSMLTFIQPILRAAGLIGKIASAFLAYSFAVKPTLADFDVMKNMSSKLDVALEKWNKKAGKASRFHFQISEDVTTQSETFDKGTYYVDVTKTVTTTNRATVRLMPKRIAIPKSVIMFKQMGFDKPISAAWELIPFSFVVDWFTDISGFLAEFETDRSPARFEIIDACYSSKTEMVTTLKYRQKASHPFGLTGSDIYVQESVYERIPIAITDLDHAHLLEAASWETSSRFGPQQGILLAALAVVLHPALRRF